MKWKPSFTFGFKHRDSVSRVGTSLQTWDGAKRPAKQPTPGRLCPTRISMETRLDLDDSPPGGVCGADSSSGSSKPWLPGRTHRCHSCQRVRSVKMRVLSWVLGKFSLLLIIVVTSATTTFCYHQLLPDDVTQSSAASLPRAPHEPSASDVTHTTTTAGGGGGGGGGRREPLQRGPSHVIEGNSSVPSQTVITSARLGLIRGDQTTHLSMTSEGPEFFTSGHVVLDGTLLVQRATTLFLSADVILKPMRGRGEALPSTIVTCMFVVRTRGSPPTSPAPEPLACQRTFLRERDQQLSRVWLLFQAEAGDRLYVNTAFPSYVVSNSQDKQQSVLTAFEVGHVQ